MMSIGIDIGYSSVKVSLLDGNSIIFNDYTMHHGRAKEVLADCLKKIESICIPLDTIRYGAVTGSGSRLFDENGQGILVNETAATIEGATFLEPEAGSIIEIGGESAKYISGFRAGNSSGVNISMNSNCSAGTGSFLEEQVSRLALNIEEYSSYAMRATTIPRIAGRCSVFAKTDITHHQQEGASVEDILMGLAYAVAKNFKGTIIQQQEIVRPVVFTGGVGFNLGIITALSDVLKLGEGELIVSDLCGNASSLGTALMALLNNYEMDIPALLRFLEEHDSCYEYSKSELPPLVQLGKGDSENKHRISAETTLNGTLSCFMGIDIGSTSTNVVLINSAKEIVDYKYVQTYGNPVAALQKCFSGILREWKGSLTVAGVGITGSGRYMIGEIVGADLIRDEITAQTSAAIFMDSDVDTIFEIGGQDSKFIMVENGRVKDFQMNKICAAGTGSFIEEQAKKFSIPINDFGPIALEGRNPVDLGERCTVFIESSIASHLSKGAPIEDIAAGLCYSIVRNYLNRVVGSKKLGERIFLQGGIAYNQGVINAFRALTGKDIIIPPFFSVSGAYGAAILVSEEGLSNGSGFKGFELNPAAYDKTVAKKKRIDKNDEFNRRIEELIFEGYDGNTLPNKPTVGIPRALFTFGMFPLFSTIFRELGFNVVLSDPTSEKTIERGQDFSQDELCYPMKLINGHVAELIEKNVDYIFFPDLHTVDHPGSISRQNYGCAYMQLAFKIINQNMDLGSKGIKLLAPTIAFNMGKEFMMKSFASLGDALDRTQEETTAALQKGMRAALDFEKRMEKNSLRVCEAIKPDEKVFVLISKIYGIADPVLNMGIPGKLMDMGYKVLSFFELPEGDVSADYPNMYWPFGQHILEPAKLIKEHPNMYAVFLSHHCCGPDSVFIHYFREIMGDKPYLNIEVDEHSSGVGVITRIEAFINSISRIPVSDSAPVFDILKNIPEKKVEMITALQDIPQQLTVYLPSLFPYSEIAAVLLNRQGIKAEVLPPSGEHSIAEGRKYTLTNELLSLTALFGDVFLKLKTDRQKDEIMDTSAVYFIPQFEGAEVDGQYARLIRTRMDEKNFSNCQVFAPFVEDFPLIERSVADEFFLGIIAGDIINNAPVGQRQKLLNRLMETIKKDIDVKETIKSLGAEVSLAWTTCQFKKCLFAIGEPLVLYSSYLNEGTFHDLEKKDNRIIFAPLSVALLMLWRDRADITGVGRRMGPEYSSSVEFMEDMLKDVSQALGSYSPFSTGLGQLGKRADDAVGYYAGAFGRYRCAAALAPEKHIDGVISVSSTYENTGISINTLHKGFVGPDAKPLLNLTFDGNNTESNNNRVESFLYYL
jgi:predicted CoA-substrate-specific enzyme activase